MRTRAAAGGYPKGYPKGRKGRGVRGRHTSHSKEEGVGREEGGDEDGVEARLLGGALLLLGLEGDRDRVHDAKDDAAHSHP